MCIYRVIDTAATQLLQRFPLSQLAVATSEPAACPRHARGPEAWLHNVGSLLVDAQVTYYGVR